jgi:hypothetical protein
MDVGPDLSPGLIAAWDGIYHFFGGRGIENWELTPDGIVISGFTVNAKYDPERILRDVNRKDRRTQLFPAISWLMGNEPAPFTTPQQITQHTVQYYKGSVEEGTTRAAKYVKDAVNEYRTRTGNAAARRGPKPKSIPLKGLASIDASLFREVSSSDLEHLQAVLAEVQASQASATVEASS